jgi:hypothetical protein
MRHQDGMIEVGAAEANAVAGEDLHNAVLGPEH